MSFKSRPVDKLSTDMGNVAARDCASAFGRSVNMCRFMCVRYHTQTAPPLPPLSVPSRPSPLHMHRQMRRCCLCFISCFAAVLFGFCFAAKFAVVSSSVHTLSLCACERDSARERELQCIVSLI